MSKICKITKKKTIYGNNRSNSMKSTRKKFLPNLQNHKIWHASLNKFIYLRVSTKALRLINKKGLDIIINNN